MLRRGKLLALKLCVSAGLIWYLLSKTDISAVVNAAGRINIQYFMIAVLISFIIVLIRSYKWQLLLNIQGAKLSLYHIVTITYVSLFFNNFALGSIAGDLFRVHKTKDSCVLKTGSLSSVIMERLTGLVMLFALVFIFGSVNLFSPEPVLLQKQFYLIIIYGSALLLTLYLSYLMFVKASKSPLFHRFPRIRRITEDFGQSIDVHRRYKRIIFFCLIASIVFYLMNSLVMYFICLSANHSVRFIQLAVVVPLITLIAMIPISANGIGIQEGAYYFFFSRIGLDSESSLLIALLPRIIMLLFSFIGASLYLFETRLRQSSSPDLQSDTLA